MYEDEGLLPVIEDASDADEESRLRLRRVDAPSDEMAPKKVIALDAYVLTDASTLGSATWTKARTLKPLEPTDRPAEVSSEVEEPPADSLILGVGSDLEGYA